MIAVRSLSGSVPVLYIKPNNGEQMPSSVKVTCRTFYFVRPSSLILPSAVSGWIEAHLFLQN